MPPPRLPRLLSRLVARAKPVIPEAAWPTLLTLRSLAGDGPVIGLPEFDRVLVLVAHPDDEAIACSGTIALLTDRGASVEILALTDGEATIGAATDPAETGRRRRVELTRSADVLGAATSFAGLPDGDLAAHRPALVEAIGAAIGRTTPAMILSPWLGDGHRDHRAVAFALAEVDAGLVGDAQIWGYETWAAVPHNRLVDVTSVMGRKEASVAAHATGSLAFDLSSGLGLSRWRSMHGLLGKGNGEAFLASTFADHVELAHRLEALDDGPADGTTS